MVGGVEVGGGWLWLFLSAGAIGLWSFLAVAIWSGERRKEREAFYRSETLKKLGEMGESGLALIRQDQQNARLQRRENLKLGGLITLAAGIALMIFLNRVDGSDAADRGAYWVGLIPALVGVAMLVYAYLLAPKE